MDLVNGKPIPFGDRGVTELTASVLVPRGICPDLLGERCWDQKQLCTALGNNSISPRLSDESPAEEADAGGAAVLLCPRAAQSQPEALPLPLGRSVPRDCSEALGDPEETSWAFPASEQSRAKAQLKRSICTDTQLDTSSPQQKLPWSVPALLQSCSGEQVPHTGT